MTVERMLEYIILKDLAIRVKQANPNHYLDFVSKYDISKMDSRLQELQDEVLKPYVISKAGN